jgi:signal transduction histidine kinase
VRGTTVGKGGGLGLAIVRRLCELYGWQVSLAPRPQGGATATLDFGRYGYPS